MKIDCGLINLEMRRRVKGRPMHYVIYHTLYPVSFARQNRYGKRCENKGRDTLGDVANELRRANRGGFPAYLPNHLMQKNSEGSRGIHRYSQMSRQHDSPYSVRT